MGRRLGIVLLVAFMCAPAGRPASASRAVRLYVFAGQSNMVGASTESSDLPDIAPALLTNSRRIGFFGPTDDHAVRWGRLGPITEMRQAFYGPGFGPELAAAPRLAALHPDEDIAIVKFARNGTSLFHDWSIANPGGLYDQMLARVRAAIRALGPHADVRPSGFFWMQGEWDSDSAPHAAAYHTELTAFIARLRADLRAPTMPVVIGRIADMRVYSPGRRFGGVVRDAQAVVAAQDPWAFLVSSDGLSHDPRSRIHFDSAGTIGLGQRFVRGEFHL